MSRPVYLDNNATTSLLPGVRDAMAPFLGGQFGNPLTAHRFGEAPRGAVEAARRSVREVLGDRGEEFRVVFCSGASEALNHAVKGLAFAALEGGRAGARKRIVIGGIEHYAVHKPATWLADRFGFEVVTVPPDRDGVVTLERLDAEVRADDTLLVALHWANNEIGTLQPVEALGALCRDRGVPFLCDTVQVIGKLDASGACSFSDLLALSAHKFHGPKGAGALLVRDGLALDPLVHGATQEGGERGGTHNVAGIVGLGAAAAHAAAHWRTESERLSGLRDALFRDLERDVDGVHWNGRGAPLLPNTLNVSFDGCPSSVLCEEMDRRGFAISAGAACHSGRVKPSRNLTAMGLSPARATTSVRIALGSETSAHDVHAAATALRESVAKVRASL